jgi:tetratricopeptide (TPR) repeat protein
LENGYGDPDKAQEWLVKCLRIRKRTLPPEHPLLATTMDNLAKALADKSLMSEASAYFERALVIRNQVFGGEHPETNNTRVNWGTYLFQNKRFAEAGKLFHKAWQADSLRFGSGHYYALMDAVTCLACSREESAFFTQRGHRKSAIRPLKAAYETACALAENAKNSNKEAKEAVIRAMEKMSAQASIAGAVSLAKAFRELADSLSFVVLSQSTEP